MVNTKLPFPTLMDKVNENMNVAIPDNPESLVKFKELQEAGITIGLALLKHPDLSDDIYQSVFNTTQQHAELLLDTELKIGEQIKMLPTAQGQRTDKNTGKGDKTKKEIIKTKFGLSERQAYDISKLTKEAVEKAKKLARDRHEIVTRATALRVIKNQIRQEKSKPIHFKGEYCNVDIENTIPQSEPKKYTQLFANVGIGEYYLEQKGFVSAVANELSPERAKWYKELYPNTQMIEGSFADQSVFDALVAGHKQNGCKIILASPPCQTFSLAGKRDFSDPRTNLFMKIIEFAKAVNEINRAIMIENVPEFLTATPADIPELNGKNIGEYMKQELESLGYHVNIDIINGADYGTAQSRERAVILACKDGIWKFPKKNEKRPMLFEILADLPSLEVGQDSGIQYHDTLKINFSPEQVECLKHTPTGCSAHDNPDKYKPVKKDGSPSKAQFKTSYQRKYWGTPCNTITGNSGDIAGFRTIHPGRPLSDGTYSDARPLTILELLRVTGLPDNYPIPQWALNKPNEQFIREVIGECFLPRLVARLMTTLP